MKKVQECSAGDHASTYLGCVVGVESRVMDNKISIQNVDGSSALEVECGRAPDIERKLYVGPPDMEESSGHFS